jgi:hypothetical protein
MKKKELPRPPKMYVLIHPLSMGYQKRACDDWNKRIVKQQGSILLPDGQEARPGATYAVDPGPGVVDMIADGILLAGSKVI